MTGRPIEWVLTFAKRTGFSPVGEIVWLYDEEAPLFGRPYALTEAAERALERWEQIRK